MLNARRVAIAVSISLILIAIIYRVGKPTTLPGNYSVESKPILGQPGSAHKHASILISINGAAYDLNISKYMERSEFAHMHDNDGRYIHVHATGVTLAYFLETLGIKITNECLTLDTGQGMCSGKMAGTEDNYKLTILVNKKSVTSPSLYVIEDQDKILIDYSTSTDFELQLMANAVPDLTEDLLNGVE